MLAKNQNWMVEIKSCSKKPYDCYPKVLVNTPLLVLLMVFPRGVFLVLPWKARQGQIACMHHLSKEHWNHIQEYSCVYFVWHDNGDILLPRKKYEFTKKCTPTLTMATWWNKTSEDHEITLGRRVIWCLTRRSRHGQIPFVQNPPQRWKENLPVLWCALVTSFCTTWLVYEAHVLP